MNPFWVDIAIAATCLLLVALALILFLRDPHD
jgi:hypothetical protein